MKKLALVLLLLQGCGATPYIEFGTGYSMDTAHYYTYSGGSPAQRIALDETGIYGTYGLGVEFQDEKWYSPSECGYYHRSMADVMKGFELVFNDVGCKKRIRFGAPRK